MIAAGTIGTSPPGVAYPRPRSSSQRMAPSAAASPKALPPLSTTPLISAAAGERPDHIRLPRAGPAAAHVDPRPAPRRHEHRRAAGEPLEVRPVPDLKAVGRRDLVDHARAFFRRRGRARSRR